MTSFADTFTPAGLALDERTHEYTLDGQPLLSVTGAIRTAGLVDTAYFDESARDRGARVAQAIWSFHAFGVRDLAADLEPYLRGYHDFLRESGFIVHAVEERLASRALLTAGTLDLRGRFDAPTLAEPLIDLIDVKTGSVPEWVGYQTAGYARLLPNGWHRRTRRWCLLLRENGSYSLYPLAKASDDFVFLAAVTVAQARRGWLR